MSRTARRGLLVIALLVAAWIAVVAFTLTAAANDASEGVRAIEAARELQLDHPDDLIEPLTDARSSFASARDRTRGVLLAPARVLPWLGRQIGALEDLSNAAAEVTDAGIEAATDADAVASRPLGGGGARVAGLRDLAEITRRARDRIASVDLGPGKDLLGVIADRRARLQTEIVDARDALDTATAALGSLAGLLEGPRTILLLGANNAEMRAGSGMFLTAGVLRARAGTLTLGRTRSVTDIQPPPGAVRPAGDLRDRWGWLSPADDWRNLMLSPRFDASAPLAARMWRAATGRTVDAVIALDPLAIESLLEVTGPVRADGRRVSADNVLDELLQRQYERFVGAKAQRREAIGEIAHAVFAALNARSIEPVPLFRALASAVRGRHLMAWSARADEHEAFARARIDGAMTQRSLLVAVLNRGGNKLDRWLEIDAQMTITPDADGADGVLALTLKNEAPGGLPRYVAGPSEVHGTRTAGEYLGFVAVSLPSFAGEGRIEGAGSIVALGPDGPTRVVAGEVRIARGKTKIIRVLFRLGQPSGELDVEPSAREPSIRWEYGDGDWRDRKPRTLRW